MHFTYLHFTFLTRTMHPNAYNFLMIAVHIIHAVIGRRLIDEKGDITFENLRPNIAVAYSGIHYNPYSKQHPGRHVCTAQKNLTIPVKTKESYCKPVYKKYVEPCDENQMCTGIRLIYETSYRDIVINKTTKQITYICCPGWVQVSNRSHGCNRPVCTTKCQNGGSCSKQGSCMCLKGFTGHHCEIDINECADQKPCDQICHNTYGSFKCGCRENFLLESDGQTCRKEGGDGEPGLEAKDLEFELLDKRLNQLETMFGTNTPEHNSNSELRKLSRSVEGLTKEVNYLKDKVQEAEKYKNNVFSLIRKVEELEKKTNDIDEMRVKYEKIKSYIWSNKMYLT